MRPVWVHPGLRSHTGMRIHSVCMMFHHGRFDVSLTQCKVIKIQNINKTKIGFHHLFLRFFLCNQLSCYYYLHSTYLTRIYTVSRIFYSIVYTFFADSTVRVLFWFILFWLVLYFILTWRHAIVKTYFIAAWTFHTCLVDRYESHPGLSFITVSQCKQALGNWRNTGMKSQTGLKFKPVWVSSRVSLISYVKNNC